MQTVMGEGRHDQSLRPCKFVCGCKPVLRDGANAAGMLLDPKTAPDMHCATANRRSYRDWFNRCDTSFLFCSVLSKCGIALSTAGRVEGHT